MWGLDHKESWALFNCGVGKASWESFGLQEDQTSQFWWKSVLNIHWKDWCWSWNSNTWPPDAKNWLIWKDPDAGKDWRQEEKGMTEDKMVGLHQWLNGHEFDLTASSGSWWWTRKPGMLQSMGSQRVGHDWATKLNWTECINSESQIPLFSQDLLLLFGDFPGLILWSL